MYELIYSQINGKVASIRRLLDNASIPLCEGNIDYQEFLKWNSQQTIPLDLNSTIEPIAPEPVRDLAAEIDLLKAKVTTLESKVK